MTDTLKELKDRIFESVPLQSRIVSAKNWVDEIDRQIAALIRERSAAAFHLDRLLIQNAKTLETEVQTGTRSIHSEDFFGPNVTGFENSPMRQR
jgi:hypothetical protein